MTDEELTKINESIKGKIGDEAFAMIGDDLGLIITGREMMQKEIEAKQSEISDLQSKNEKLVEANAGLFKQIPVAKETKSTEDEETSRYEKISLRDAFDAKGNFKH